MKKITFERFQVNFRDGFDWLPVFNSNYLDLKGKYGIGKYKSMYSLNGWMATTYYLYICIM